jgi:hypothetical protein
MAFLNKGCRLNLTLHNAKVTYYSQPNFGRSLKIIWIIHIEH